MADLPAVPEPLASAPEPPEPPLERPRSPLELFLTFSWISLRSFGGALAFIERTVVVEKRWLDARAFLGLFGIAQVLPGPSGIAFCVLLGDRCFGVRGAAAALAGFLLPPAVLVLCLAALFQHFNEIAWVRGALQGMGAASVGLIAHTAARLARTLKGERIGIAVALLTFAAVGLGRLSVRTVLLTLGVASVAWAWHMLGRAKAGGGGAER